MSTAPSSPTKNKFLGAEGGWDEESTRELLLKMKKVVPVPDSSKYKTLLEKFDWARVASGLKFSEVDCKSQWAKIYKKLRKFKTLSDLIEDSLEYVENPYKGCVKKHPDHPKRPLTPYFRFFLEERERYAASHKNLTNLQITSILSKKYREIPISEKERYLAEWKSEMCDYRVKMEKFKKEHPEHYDKMPPKPSRTPLQIFNQECMENLAPKSKKSKKEIAESLKNKYHVLEDDLKMPYILKAMEEFEKYKEELEMYKKTHPTFVPGSIHKKSFLTKDDWRIYDKSLGRPNRPPANGYNLFCTRLMVSEAMKHLSSRERIMECGQKWKLLTNAEKQAYHKEFMQMREKYRIEQKSFLKKLSPKEREEYLARKSEAESKRIHKRKIPITIKQEELSDANSASSSDEAQGVPNDSSSDESSSSSESSDEDDDDEEAEEEKKEEKETNGLAAKAAPGPVRPTTPISALFLYQKAHKAKLAEKHPEMSISEITLTLARRFVNLPPEKKAKYQQKEKEQRALYTQEIQKFLLAETTPMKQTAELKPITGEQVYHDQNRETYLKKCNGTQNKVEEALRKAWTHMSKERRKKYINIAHELNAKNIAEHQAAQAKKDHDQKKSMAIPEKKLSQKEIRGYLVLEPKKVPKDALVLFKKEHRPKLNHLLPGARNQELHRLWSEMNVSSKNKYKQRAKEGLVAYNKKLQRWINSLPPQVKEIYESSLVKTKKEKPESSPKAIIANGKKRKEQVATSNAEDKVKKKKLEKKVEKDSDSSDDSSDEEGSSSSSSSDSDNSSSSSSDDDTSSSGSSSTDSANNGTAVNKSPGSAKEEESSGDSSSSSSSDDDEEGSDDSD